MGVSVFGGALTTVAATWPLLLCVILIFSRFGALIVTNTILSVVFSLTLFPTLLAWIGPSGRTGQFSSLIPWLLKRCRPRPVLTDRLTDDDL